MKRWLYLLLTCMLLACLCGCKGDNAVTTEAADPGYSVNITVKCHKNLIFSKYGIRVFVDDVEVGTLSHGSSGIYQLDLTQGDHTLKIEREDDSSIKGTLDFSVTKDTDLSYEATCTSINIEIEEGISEDDEEATTSEKIVIRRSTEAKATTTQADPETTTKDPETTTKPPTASTADPETTSTTQTKAATTFSKPVTTQEKAEITTAQKEETTTAYREDTAATTQTAPVEETTQVPLSSEAAQSEPSTEEKKDTKLSVTMLNVGQGLSILLECDGEYMLYDGGGRDYSSYVVSYLQKQGITEFKYIVASHYDEDHIAGLVGVLNTIPVKTAIIPDLTAETNIYDSLMEKIQTANPQVVYPAVGDSYKLGSADVTVLAPAQMSASDENNSSIVMKVTLGEFSCLLTGDAETGEEQELMDSGCDLASTLLVVAHHGSAGSTGGEFLKAVAPAYAFVSVGANNAYGHPTEQTMNRLLEAGVKMFRTDLQGEVTITTDGTLDSVTSSVAPCEDYSPGVIAQSSESTTEAAATTGNTTEAADNEEKKTYILNISTLKIHEPSCGSINAMSDKNKKEVELTEKETEDLLSQGYTYCGNCH